MASKNMETLFPQLTYTKDAKTALQNLAFV